MKKVTNSVKSFDKLLTEKNAEKLAKYIIENSKASLIDVLDEVEDSIRKLLESF